MLGWPFCAECKNNRISEHRRTQNGKKVQAPRCVRKSFQKTPILGPTMAPKYFQKISRRPAGSRWRPKTQPRAANHDQKGPKSEPKVLQEHPEAIFTIFPALGGVPMLIPPGVDGQAWGSGFGGVGPLERRFRLEGVSIFLFFGRPRKKCTP